MSTTATSAEEIVRAVQTLAGVCDGAVSEDGIGFNGQDSKWGKQMSTRAPEHWTTGDLYDAHQRLKKYRAQLSRLGIEYADLPTPERPSVEDKRARRQSIAFIDGLFEVRFPFNESLTDEVKLIHGRRWNGGRKAWTVPPESQERLREFADAHGFSLAPSALQVMGMAPSRPAGAAPRISKLVGRPGWRCYLDGPWICFESPFDQPFVDAVRKVPTRLFVKEKKSWMVSVIEADAALDLADKFDFQLDDDLTEASTMARQKRAEAEAARQQHEQEAAEKRAAEMRRRENSATEEDRIRALSYAEDGEVDVGTDFGFDLRHYQRAAVAYALECRKILLGDQVGTGKTISSLASLRAHQLQDQAGPNEFYGRPAVIVVPPSLIINWRRETAKAYPMWNIETLKGTKAKPIRTRPNIIIVSDAIVHAWVEEILALDPYAIICDESHRMKSKKARRTVATSRIAKSIPDGGLSIYMSGTPVTNRPSEYAPQLTALGIMDKLGGWKYFMKTYCGWSPGERANEDEVDPETVSDLPYKLRGIGYMRRLKSDVLKELPPIMLPEVYVNLDEDVMVEYRKAEDDIVQFVGDEARRIAQEIGEDPWSAEVHAKMRAEAAKHLVRLNRLRRLAARAKLPATVEWITTKLTELEDDGLPRRLLVFCHHRDIHEHIMNHLIANKIPAVSIIGGMSNDRKQAAVDAMQGVDKNDPEYGQKMANIHQIYPFDQAEVAVLAIEAAGVGLTLTEASNAGFVEQPWTPAALDQAVGRMHRIGQIASLVEGHILIGERTIDEEMAEVIARKRKLVDAATDGYEKEEIRIAEEAAKQLGRELTEDERKEAKDRARGRAQELLGQSVFGEVFDKRWEKAREKDLVAS